MTGDKKVQEAFDWLMETYGTQNDGFHRNHPWQHLIAIMLSAQSTDKQVEKALPGLYERFDTVQEVAAASVEEIESYIRSVGIYKNKAKNMKKCCAQIVEQFHGKVPETREELTSLAGIGRKTANLYMANELGIPEITVDTHVHRLSNRLGWVQSNNVLQTEKQLQKVLRKDQWSAINILLIRHGRAICRARNPKCEECQIKHLCDYYQKKEK